MSTRIRLRRAGRKHVPFYHIGIFDIRQRRDADCIERIGHFDPEHKDAASQVVLDKERAQYWLSTGAKPSETVAAILKKQGLVITENKDKGKRKAKPRKQAAGVKPRTKARTSKSKTRKLKTKKD